MDLKYYYADRMFKELFATQLVKSLLPQMTYKEGGISFTGPLKESIEVFERVALCMEGMFYSSGYMADVEVEEVSGKVKIIVQYKKMSKKEKQELLVVPELPKFPNPSEDPV